MCLRMDGASMLVSLAIWKVENTTFSSDARPFLSGSIALRALLVSHRL